MSFSFAVSGKTKDEVSNNVRTEMDKIVQGQPHHSHDRDAVVSSVEAYVGLLNIKDGDMISVSVSGSLGWTGKDDAAQYTGAGISISARTHQNP